MTARQLDADVCVVGAGYAGLTAARRLTQGGKSVVVLEARDRVGGRVWTQRSNGGVIVDMGGTFVGPMHDRLHALTKEMGVSTFATYTKGDSIIATGGKVRRYRGEVPRLNPFALLSAGQAIFRLDRMAKKVPLDAPWDAPSAGTWDAYSVRSWLTSTNVPTRMARDLLEATVHALFCCDLSEVSLLNLLFLVNSAPWPDADLAVRPFEGTLKGFDAERFALWRVVPAPGGDGRATDVDTARGPS